MNPTDATPGKPGESGDPVLKVRHLSTSFESKRGVVQAVSDVSLSIGAGRTLGIVGETGSGKSVLVRSIMGLESNRGNTHVTGEVILNGRPIMGLSARSLRSIWGTEAALIFQDSATALNPVKKIGALIAEPLIVHRSMTRRQARARSGELLHAVGISDPGRRLDQYPHELSGGMRQRVAIAIALTCEPRLLIADEPTTALDVTVQEQILNVLQAIQQSAHMAMILISHDLRVVAGRTDDTLVMYGGRVVERAPTKALFRREVLMPYTEALLDAVPHIENPSHTPLQAIPGHPPRLLQPLPPGCAFAPRCAYAQDICRSERPKLESVDRSGHEIRCWFPARAETRVAHSGGDGR